MACRPQLTAVIVGVPGLSGTLEGCSGRGSQFQWLTARLLVGAIISVRLKEDQQTELRRRLARVSGKGGGDLANA